MNAGSSEPELKTGAHRGAKLVPGSSYLQGCECNRDISAIGKKETETEDDEYAIRTDPHAAENT